MVHACGCMKARIGEGFGNHGLSKSVLIFGSRRQEQRDLCRLPSISESHDESRSRDRKGMEKNIAYGGILFLLIGLGL